MDREDSFMADSQISDLIDELAALKSLIQKVVEMNIHRGEDSDYFCHECKSWNHTADVDDRCTTAMLQNYMEGE